MNCFIIILYSIQFCFCFGFQLNETKDKFIFDQNYKTIKTNKGFIRGITDFQYKIPVHVFKGIPYAKPPVGGLRFKRPIEITKRFDTYDAFTSFSHCAQNVHGLFKLYNEDCLYLNIWAPDIKEIKLPVIIVIHGGGLIIGSGIAVEGVHLAQRNVIVVAINYRLGVFGFVYSGTEEAPGNQALWDQAMAIKWVKSNINSFGGDPDDITLLGESAGAWCVSIHAVSPITKNLFRKAIIMSGTVYPKFFAIDKQTAYQYSKTFAEKLGIKSIENKTNFINLLKNRSIFELIENESDQNLFTGDYFRPIYGDRFLPEPLFKALKKGHFNPNSSFLLGHTEMEGIFFASTHFGIKTSARYNPFSNEIGTNPNPYKNDIKSTFLQGVFTPNIRQYICDEYMKIDKNYKQKDFEKQVNAYKFAAVHALGDCFVTCPTILFGVNLIKNPLFNGNVFQFRLTYRASKSFTSLSQWAGTTHTDEYTLMFGFPFDKQLSILFPERDRYMSETLMNIITDFTKTGIPTPNQTQNKTYFWPKYILKSDGNVSASYVELNPETNRFLRKHTDAYRGEDGYGSQVINNCINFWEKIYENDFNLY